MNISMILYVLAWVMKIEGICMVLPLICAMIYHENTALAIAAVAAFSYLLGSVMGMKHPKHTDYYAREGFAAVALSWIVMSLIGALPFYLSGRIPSYVDCVFEIVSGFTTTGSSILKDVEYIDEDCFSGEASHTGSAVWAFWFLSLPFCRSAADTI